MADNAARYGFRWNSAWNGGKSCPVPIRMTVATGKDHVDDSGNSVDLNIGDVVKIESTGTVTICEDTGSPYGIIVGVHPYWDGTVMKPSSKVPNQNAWGTVEARRPWVDVVPVTAGIWEVDVDDATTATTYAAYIALVGENCNHFSAGNTANTSAAPKLDISSHATTAALDWRIVGISQTAENKDFSGANVKLLVAANTSQLPTQAATTVAGV